MGLAAASERTASTRPRSASTGGRMPRTSDRSSLSAAEESSFAAASIARAPSGSCSSSRWACVRVMPMVTSRAWAPSCRSRSMRRISASCSSSAVRRVAVSDATRSSSDAVELVASM